MIIQGQNNPLVIRLTEDVSTASEIHVEMHNALRQIKHWEETEIEVLENFLLCPLTQEDTLSFPVGRAFASAKWLRADGSIGMIKNVPISVGKGSDDHILGDDEPITETDLVYDGDLAECQGVLNPESIRSAIVVKAYVSSGGGTTDYSALSNKPSINGVTLSGNKSLSDIGAASASHTHSIANVTGLQNALDGKVASTDSRLTDARQPTAHSHTIANVTGLQTALDGKQASGSYASSVHGHSISDVSGLQSALDGKVGNTDSRLTDARTPTSHSHAVADVTGFDGAVKTALTTGDSWTGTEKSSARQKLGFVQLTQEEYNLLVTPDENTIYIIVGDGT